MNTIVQFVMKQGYSILFAGIFAHQIGVPLPGLLFLLAAAALAAAGKLSLVASICLAVSACVLADWVWYEACRLQGERLSCFIQRVVRSPKASSHRSKKIFAQYGIQLLIVAKFIPGLDAVMPPLAGTSRADRLTFLALDAVGAALYSGAYTGLGYLCSHDLDRAAAYAGRAGTVLAGLVFAAISIYAAYKLVQRHRESQIVRISPADPIGCSVINACGIVEGLHHKY